MPILTACGIWARENLSRERFGGFCSTGNLGLIYRAWLKKLGAINEAARPTQNLVPRLVDRAKFTFYIYGNRSKLHLPLTTGIPIHT
jgi:hypothetical protein